QEGGLRCSGCWKKDIAPGLSLRRWRWSLSSEKYPWTYPLLKSISGRLFLSATPRPRSREVEKFIPTAYFLHVEHQLFQFWNILNRIQGGDHLGRQIPKPIPPLEKKIFPGFLDFTLPNNPLIRHGLFHRQHLLQ